MECRAALDIMLIWRHPDPPKAERDLFAICFNISNLYEHASTARPAKNTSRQLRRSLAATLPIYNQNNY
jgi:hypothetical protein